jgi:Kef-type K+ transport system membrane component KefB
MNTDMSFLHFSALILLGIATIIGYYMGCAARRITLPSLIGYMICGVIIGPSVLNLFDEPMIQHLSFLPEIALGFVAFTSVREQKRMRIGLAGCGRITRLEADKRRQHGRGRG